MIQTYIEDKYQQYLDGFEAHENTSSIIVPKIVVKPEYRGSGIGKQIMSDLVNYADNNKQIVSLTPSSDYGGDKNKLIQFYKTFGFKHNQGQYQHSGINDTMVRYPKLNENKSLIKSLLREQLLTKEKKDILQVTDFVNFAKHFLNINDDIQIELAYERTPDLTTTAYYNLDGFIKVYVKERAIIDVCRSIAHELVHHKQNLDGRLMDAAKDGEDGSNIENEANAVAGVIIRKWGKMNPEFYN